MHPAGHINPCVSLSAFITQNISFALMVAYWCAHLLGAVVGSSIQYAFYNSGGGAYGTFYPMRVTQAQAFGYETLATFLFVLLVQSCALRFSGFLNPHVDVTATDSGTTGPITIGLTLTGLAFAIGPLTGCSVNFARTLGPAIVFRRVTAADTIVLLVAELTGTLCASAVALISFGTRRPAEAMLNLAPQQALPTSSPAQATGNTAAGECQSQSWSSVTTPPRTTPDSPLRGTGIGPRLGVKSLIHRRSHKHLIGWQARSRARTVECLCNRCTQPSKSRQEASFHNAEWCR